ncbi:MAG: hypothetical protein JXQ95_19185 [Alteromonas stellipolaris]|uniref:hypothetical protein n=1 Tax=Alteromonas stellipolaris TaxID=233316 RepID=UPI003B8CA794
MIDRTKLKHIVVFTFAFVTFGFVPIFLMHVLTNVFDIMSVQNDTARALLMISPMACCMAGIAIAMLYVAKHPELL